MDRVALALFALLLNALFGGPRAVFEASNMVRIGRIPAKLLRDQEPKFSTPDRHVLLVLYSLIAAFVLGLFLHFLLGGNLKFIELFMLAVLLPVRPAFERAFQIRQALARGQLAEARQLLEGTVWKHHVLLDAHGVARAAIELLVVNFCEKVLAPLVWYLLLGLPGFLVCKTIGLLKETLPAKYQAEQHINRLLFRFPVLIQWICSRLASILWIAVSVMLPFSAVGKTVERLGAASHKTPAAAYQLFAAATILGLALGGPTSAYWNASWQGAGTPNATPADIGRALTLYGFTFLVLVVLLGLSL